MDITRFALMKMMGGGRLPFPGAPPGVLDLGRESKDRREEEEEERENNKEEDDEEEERRFKEEGRRKLVQERTIDCKDFEGNYPSNEQAIKFNTMFISQIAASKQ